MKLKITFVLTFFIGLINAQNAWEDLGSPNFMGTTDVQDLVILDNGTPVVAFATSGLNTLKFRQWKNNSWQSLPDLTPTFSPPPFLSDLTLLNLDNTLYLAIGDGSNALEVYRLDGAAWTGLDNISLNGLSYTAGSAKLAISDQTDDLTLSFGSFGGQGDLPQVYKFDGTTWDPAFGDDLNMIFNDPGNEASPIISELFHSGPETYFYNKQTEPGVGASITNGNVTKASGGLDELRLYKFDGSWAVCPDGNDFIVDDPSLLSMAGDHAGGTPYIAFTEASIPDILQVKQKEMGVGYNPLIDFDAGSEILAMDMTLDFLNSPLIAIANFTNDNKVMSYNGGSWDQIPGLFSTATLSFVDIEVFKSSNKKYVLYVSDSGTGVKVYNNAPQVPASPGVNNICQDAGNSNIVSDLEILDSDHDSIYIVSATSSNTGIILDANITVSRTSVYDPFSNDNHFSINVTPESAATGSVTITVTYSDGFQNYTETIPFMVNSNPNISPLADEFICNGGSFFLNASGIDTYTWDSGDLNGTNVTPAASGTFTYTLTATDLNGCQATDMMDVTVYPVPTFNLTANDVLCNGGSDGSISITGLNASQNYNINHDFNASPTGPISYTTNAAGEINITSLPMGTYENFSVEDVSNGCISATNIGPYTIGEPTAISINPLADEIHCEGTSIILSGNASGGTGIINYSWDNGVIDGNSFIPPATATYTLTATDQNLCTATDNMNITINAAPPIFTTTQIDPTTCGGSDGSITLEGLIGSTSYDLSYDDGAVQGPNTITTDAIGESEIINLSAGSFTNINVENGDGCSRLLVGPISLSDPGSPFVNPVNDQTICANSDFNLVSFTGTAGATFSWTNDNTSIGLASIGSGDIPVFAGLNSGTISETATLLVTPSLGGCTGVTESFNFIVDPIDDAGYSYSSTSLCEDETLSPIVTTNTAGGTFTYTVVSGGPTLMQNTSNGTIGIAFSNIGSYDVTYTTTGVCPNSSTTNITINPTPTITITQPTIQICNNASALNMNGIGTPLGGTYDGTGISNNYFDPNSMPVDGYSYTYNYTDANGCSSTEFGIVEVLEIPDISLNLTNTTCGNTTGSAISNVTGGLAPYTYYWSNGTDGPEITNLTSSTYYLNVTDDNDCYVMDVAAIQTDEIDIIYSSVFSQCSGDNSGEIELIITGTTGPYTYFWSNGETTPEITNLEDGQYEVFVTDADGCTSSHTTEISSPLPFSTEITTTLPTSCGATDGSILADVQGAVPAYTYEWKNEAGTIVGTNALLSNIGQGVYTLLVTDFVGCVKEYTTVLSETGAPLITVDQITSASCANDGAIDISVNSTNSITSTLWSNLATSEDVSGLTNGFYSVKVTDDNGCVGNLGVNVNPVIPDYIDICMVTVNENTNTNLVVWEKPVSTEIDHFIVYRETSIAGKFLPVGTVDYDDESLFTDPVAYPQLRSWRYKLGVVNTCGVPSELSPAHKTMHITISQEVAGVYTINWDNYEGFTFPSFDVYRFTDLNGWELLSALPTTNFSYIDTPPSTIGLDYMVSITPPTVCTSSKAQDHNASRSNTTSSINIGPGENTGNTDGITESELENIILIYPNPSASFFNIHMNVNLSTAAVVNVYDIKGSVVQSFEIDSPDFIVQLQNFDNGMYILEINTGKAIVRKQLIKK